MFEVSTNWLNGAVQVASVPVSASVSCGCVGGLCALARGSFRSASVFRASAFGFGVSDALGEGGSVGVSEGVVVGVDEGVVLGVVVGVVVVVGVGVGQVIHAAQDSDPVNPTPVASYRGPDPSFVTTVAHPLKSKEPVIL